MNRYLGASLVAAFGLTALSPAFAQKECPVGTERVSYCINELNQCLSECQSIGIEPAASQGAVYYYDGSVHDVERVLTVSVHRGNAIQEEAEYRLSLTRGVERGGGIVPTPSPPPCPFRPEVIFEALPQ